MNFISNFIKKTESNKNLFFVQAEEEGLECWHYVLVDKIRTPLIHQKIRQTPCQINLNEYGKIVYSGWGKEPKPEIKDRVEAGDYSKPVKTADYKVMYVQNEQEGKPFYAFVLVKWELAEKFEYIANFKGNMNLSNWGIVLKTGWGFPQPNEIEELITA